MTDEKNVADGGGGYATADGSPHAHRASERRPWVAAILHRWPTWLAIAMAALLAPGSSLEELSEALPLLAFGYLAAAVVQRRGATWLLAVGVIAAFAALKLQSWVDPVAALIAVARGARGRGGGDGRLHRDLVVGIVGGP